MTKPRVAVLMTYFGLFDEGMPVGFREQRLAAGGEAAAAIRSIADCEHVYVVDSAEAASEASQALSGVDVDAVIIVPTMATPPEWAASVVRGLQPMATVVVAIREFDEVPAGYDTTQATSNSLLVGVVMLTNALLRDSLVFDLVLATRGQDDLEERLDRSLRAAHGAARVRSARLLAFGEPIPGYSDVAASNDELGRLSVQRVSVDAADVRQWSEEVTVQDLAETVARARALGEVNVDAEVLSHAAHVACVVRRAIESTGASAGSINCHGPLVRQNPTLGVTGCLAVSLLASEGVMISCTGDVPVAIALVLGRAIAGSAVYCELYAVDQPGDWILAANGGEGDASGAVPGSVRLLPEDHYLGVNGPGVAVAFDLPKGPATICSLSPVPGAKGGWRLVLADAEVLGSDHPAMEGPNARVRVAGVPALRAFADWCTAGASHHAALLPGHHAATLATAANFLGVESVTVSL